MKLRESQMNKEIRRVVDKKKKNGKNIVNGQILLEVGLLLIILSIKIMAKKKKKMKKRKQRKVSGYYIANGKLTILYEKKR